MSDLHSVVTNYSAPPSRPEYWYVPKYLKNYTITSLWGEKKNTDGEEVEDVQHDLVVLKEGGKEPEKDCDF